MPISILLPRLSSIAIPTRPMPASVSSARSPARSVPIPVAQQSLKSDARRCAVLFRLSPSPLAPPAGGWSVHLFWLGAGANRLARRHFGKRRWDGRARLVDHHCAGERDCRDRELCSACRPPASPSFVFGDFFAGRLLALGFNAADRLAVYRLTLLSILRCAMEGLWLRHVRICLSHVPRQQPEPYRHLGQGAQYLSRDLPGPWHPDRHCFICAAIAVLVVVPARRD